MQDGPEDSGPGVEQPRPANNLPLALTSFVGRQRQMAEVERVIADHRLLTLTGPGGSGKTRLALAVASGMTKRFEEGVWLVELAPLSDPDLVPQSVASALLRTLRTLRDRVGIFHCLLGAASVAGWRGEPDRAALLWGAAEALGETAAVPLIPMIRSRYDYEGYVAAARSRLGQEAFEAAWAEGRTMTPEEAIDYALLAPETPAQAGPPQDFPSGLSAREAEVLKLVARGMTNAQIAKELFISPRTVNAHMGSVYHKIGSSTRAEATRFASEHCLL